MLGWLLECCSSVGSLIWLIGCLVGWLVVWSDDLFIGYLYRCLIGCLVGCSVEWLIGWWVERLIG